MFSSALQMNDFSVNMFFALVSSYWWQLLSILEIEYSLENFNDSLRMKRTVCPIIFGYNPYCYLKHSMLSSGKSHPARQ